jgi:gliding motility-associated-like protein
MIAVRLKKIIFCTGILFISLNAIAQQCSTDSNYYTIFYNAPNNNLINGGIKTAQNELVILGQSSTKTSFVTKFTSQGNVIWSKEYIPDYPFVSWAQYPWYNDTRLYGIANSSDSTCFVYGSSSEHGKSINGVEDPPNHSIGMLLNLDKFGNTIYAKYFGNWGTSYSVDNLIHLSGGRLLIYLRGLAFPYISRIICFNKAGDIVWSTPLQTFLPSTPIAEKPPVMKQLSNGKIIISNQYHWDIPDTLFYPFMPPILLLPPLSFMTFSVLNPNNGSILSQTSYESPSYTNTNVTGEFVPEVKSITELPNGNVSVLADVYYPIDNLIFYKHNVFSRRAVNFILDDDGYLKDFITYAPENGSCSLESVWPINNGEQILLVKDSTNQQLILFAIDAAGQVKGTKSYANPLPTNNAQGFLIEKQNAKGYFIFQSDPDESNFHFLITNAIGNDSCSQLPAAKMIAEHTIWPWPFNKVKFESPFPDVDFRYSPFNIVEKSHSVVQNISCHYQYECCKDVIDSLHPHDISICENETYRLPDSTVLKKSGTYYIPLKTEKGCDSIVLYNLKVLKSPSHLAISPDTCLNNISSIKLTATGGYDSYTWNNFTTTKDSFFVVGFPGNYSVKVENRCGSKTDTVHVYDQCDFPIYFPTAFTPNGDFLNDELRVPWANRNKLVRLRIYNRWGELVFSTTITGKGWNGNFKGIPQPAGIYAYYLEMQGLSGHKQDQKGTVLLIR